MNKYYKYFLRLAFIAVILLGTEACYKDKGNYVYHDINEITFDDETLKDSYTVDIGAPLIINPKIISSIPGSGDYTYEWVRHGIGKNLDESDRSIIKFADGLDLNYIFPGKLPARKYLVYLRVTDNNTKVQWYSKRIAVYLENVIKKGIMMMYEIGGETQLDMLNYDETNTKTFSQIKISEIFADAYPEFGKPISINCFVDDNAPYIAAPTSLKYAVLVHTETGLYRLNHTDLSYSNDYNYEKIIIGSKPAGFKVKRVVNEGNSNTLTICVTDDEIKDRAPAEGGPYNFLSYSASMTTTFMSYGLPVNREAATPLPTPVRLSEVFGVYSPSPSPNDTASVFYDLNKRRFCFYYWTYMGTSTNIIAHYTGKGGTPELDLDAVNTDCEPLAILIRPNSNPARVYSILKNTATNAVNLVSFTAAYTAAGSTKYFNKNISDLLEIDKAEDFQISMSTVASYANFLYYRTDKKIFMYDMNDGSNMDVTPAEIKAKVDAGAKISYFRPFNATDFTSKLMVFTCDEGKPAESCGSAYVCTMDIPNGTLSIANSGLAGEEVPMIWENKFGKIVSAAWKNK